MTNLETNFLEVLTREAVRFCSRAVRLFLAPLAQMRTALIQDFHGFMVFMVSWFHGFMVSWTFMVLQRKRLQGRTGHMIIQIYVCHVGKYSLTFGVL